MIRTRTLSLIVTLVALTFRANMPVMADETTDLYFQQVVERYFEYPQNARTFAMAGSSVVTSTDSSSILGNPAGLGLMGGGEFSGSYSYNTISGDEYPTGEGVSQDGSIGSTLLALPIGPTTEGLPEYGNFGIAWDGYTSTWSDDTFDTESERIQLTAAYAYGFSDSFSLGYSLGWTDDRFQSKQIFNYPMGAGFKHTLGAVYRVNSDWNLGASTFVGHGTHHALYGPGIKGDSDSLQVGFDLGATYQWGQALLAAGLDYRHLNTDGEVIESLPANVAGGDENGNIFNVRLGAEYLFTDWFRARAGYRYAGLASYKYNRVELNDLNGSAFYNAWTLGAGFVIPVSGHYVKVINVDYGVEYRAVGDNDWQHVITVAVPFNLCRP